MDSRSEPGLESRRDRAHLPDPTEGDVLALPPITISVIEVDRWLHSVTTGHNYFSYGIPHFPRLIHCIYFDLRGSTITGGVVLPAA